MLLLLHIVLILLLLITKTTNELSNHSVTTFAGAVSSIVDDHRDIFTRWSQTTGHGITIFGICLVFRVFLFVTFVELETSYLCHKGTVVLCICYTSHLVSYNASQAMSVVERIESCRIKICAQLFKHRPIHLQNSK